MRVLSAAAPKVTDQWAAGINNTPTLGILNEALGSGVPIFVSPYAKSALVAHPVFARNLRFLADVGVHFTGTNALRPDTPDGPYRWEWILDLLPAVDGVRDVPGLQDSWNFVGAAVRVLPGWRITVSSNELSTVPQGGDVADNPTSSVEARAALGRRLARLIDVALVLLTRFPKSYQWKVVSQIPLSGSNRPQDDRR